MNNIIFAKTRANAMAMMAMTMMIGGALSLRAADRPTPGAERRWTLDFRTRLEQSGAARPVEIDLSGDWVSTVSAVRADGYDAELRIESAHAGAPGNTATASQTQQLERRLERPFWATYRNDGALVAVHFYKGVEITDRNLLEMIATECQLVHATPELTSWSVLERDGAGEYLANYTQANQNTVMKQKVKYTHTDGATGKDGVPIEIDQSATRFTLDADGDATTMDGMSRARIEVGTGDAGQLTVVTETHLAGLRKRQVPKMIGSLARALSEVESSPVRTQQPDPAQLRARLDGQLLEGRTTEALLQAALLYTGESKTEDQTLPDRLAALFRQRPEAPAIAADLLRKSNSHKWITDALGSAGSPAAVAALGLLASDRALPRPLRIDALTALILTRHPSVEGMRVPEALLDDSDVEIASAARIVSGSLAQAGRADHPATSDAIDAALVSRYQKAGEAEELTVLLAAMGNSSGKLVVPVIESALGDKREAVRAASARALRLAAGPEVEGLLSASIVNDDAAGVRAAAIFAARFRNPLGPKLTAALEHAAKMDPADQVRASAITVLRQHSGAVSNLVELLQWIVEHDSKPGVRRLAQDALKTL